MRKNTMRAAAVLMTAALALTSLTGCANGGGNGSGGGNGGGIFNKSSKKGGLEVSLDHSYAGDKLDIPSIPHLNGGTLFGDQILLNGYDNDYNEMLALYDPATGSTRNVEYAYPKTLGEDAYAYPNTTFLNSDGNYTVIFSGNSWETDESGEEQYKSLGLTMEVYDKDFNVIDSHPLGSFEENVYVNQIASISSGGYVVTVWDDNSGSEKIGIYDNNLQKVSDVKANIQYIEGVYTISDGSVYLKYESEEGGPVFGSIDTASGIVTPVEIEGLPQWTNGCFESTDSSFDLYMYDSENLYGVNIQKKTCEPVINWINSDFLGNYISNVTQLHDGRFMVGASTIGNDPTSEVWVLSPRDPDAFKNVSLISMAGLYLPDDTAQAVLNFNRSHNDVRIAVVNYDKYATDEDSDAGLKKLQNDMTSGIVADLILTNGLPYESFANKGLFLDLSDRVGTLSDTDYFMNFFDALRYGDKLYHIGFSYDVQTLEGRTSVVGDKQGLSYAEFMQLVKGLPAGMNIFGNSFKEDAVSSMVGMNIRNFVDVGAGTCNFNTPEFIDLLNLCNTFPTSEEYQNMVDADPQYWEKQQEQYTNGSTAFSQTWISNLRSDYQNRFMNFGKEKVTRVGFPVSSSGGNGGRFNVYNAIAISANSQYPDQCWEFLSGMLSEDYQENLSWSLPVSRKAYDKMTEEAMKPNTYQDENGKTVTEPYTIWRGDQEIPIPDMPKSYADELRTYIEGIRDISYYDSQIMEIINEEAQKFFAGDQTAEQAANMIQSRASLYLSESA